MRTRVNVPANGGSPESEVLTLSALLVLLGRRSRQSIYDLMRRVSTFPRPRQLGSEFSIGWLRAEVMQWLHSRLLVDLNGLDAVERRRRIQGSSEQPEQIHSGRGFPVVVDELIMDRIQSRIVYRRTTMRSSQIKPISYLKANAAEVLDRLADRREPMLITQNGEAKAVIQDIASYEETQETLALLKILALGNRDVEEGRVRPLADAVRRLRARKAAA
jgi:prevent-host-death family protein